MGPRGWGPVPNLLRGVASHALTLQHLDQGGAIETEQPRRLVLVPIGALERLPNELVLEGFDRDPELDAAIGQLGGKRLGRRKAADSSGQIALSDLVRGAQEDGALDHVFQLAYVA